MPAFDPIFYLYANPDVAAAGANPRQHFELYGRDEGREHGFAEPVSEMAREFQGRQAFMQDALRMLVYNGISGAYVEFGCGGGATMVAAYREISKYPQERRALWGFDSFEGLPAPTEQDRHPEWTERAYAVGLADFQRRLQLGDVPLEAVHLVPGFYDRTLPGFGDCGDIALAYIDCDLFSSTAAVLEFLRPRLKTGMLLAFDDYYCHTREGRSGEQRAFAALRRTAPGFEFERYLPIGWHGQSFVAYAT
jgi:O-methyltransferase